MITCEDNNEEVDEFLFCLHMLDIIKKKNIILYVSCFAKLINQLSKKSIGCNQ